MGADCKGARPQGRVNGDRAISGTQSVRRPRISHVLLHNPARCRAGHSLCLAAVAGGTSSRMAAAEKVVFFIRNPSSARLLARPSEYAETMTIAVGHGSWCAAQELTLAKPNLYSSFSDSSDNRSTETTRSSSAVLSTITPCVERPAMRMPATGVRISLP